MSVTEVLESHHQMIFSHRCVHDDVLIIPYHMILTKPSAFLSVFDNTASIIMCIFSSELTMGGGGGVQNPRGPV